MILFKTSREGFLFPKYILHRYFSRTFVITDATTFSQNTVNEFITFGWVNYLLVQTIITKSFSNKLL